MTIHTVMLVSLGFLLACMLAVALTPAFRRRADRLATERVRRALPVTLEEIRADKDRLRAEHAVEVYRLEARVEEARLNAARQMVEMNRRDARICALEEEMDRVRADLDENSNARRVLEHNLSERLPRVMTRLDAAHKLLEQRDQQIDNLSTGAQKGIRALDEAMMLNAQQRAEIDRLRTTLATRRAAHFSDEGSRSDVESALRSELEALRARTRDQSNVITRLQSLLSKYGADTSEGDKSEHPATPDVDLLRRDLAEARQTLQLAGLETKEIAASAPPESIGEVYALRAKVQDQETVVKRLRAALETYEKEEAGAAGNKWNTLQASRIGAKAKINSLQAQVTSQEDIIRRLRSEVASSNERLALQAAHFRDEMRRIGAGTRPTTADIRRAQQPSRRASLVDRIGQIGTGDVVTLPRSAVAAIAATPQSVPTASAPSPAAVTAGDAKVAELKKSTNGTAEQQPAPEPGKAGEIVQTTGKPSDTKNVSGKNDSGKSGSGKKEPAAAKVGPPRSPEPKPAAAKSSVAAAAKDPAEAAATTPAPDGAEPPKKPARGRLMDRISGLTRG